MPLSTLFPLYGPLGRGNYNVSLAIPGPLSKISKYYGITASSTGVVLPNTEFIKAFALGDLGISDGFTKEMMFKSINSPIASTDEAVFKQVAKQQGLDITDLGKYKKGNKFSVPMDSIKIPDEFGMTGFKAFEKTVFQSIFETQKPYMEIAKIVMESAAKAEDVIARVSVLLTSNPIKGKSRKPKGNSGASNRPKAIGYEGGKELKDKLREFESIRRRVEPNNVKSDVDGKTNLIENKEYQAGTINTQVWKTLSTVYSTITFDSKVDYTYTYINLEPDSPYPDVEPIILESEDPYDKYKPKSIIFGIYNSKGESINPNEKLKTIGLKNGRKIDIETPFERAGWLTRSPKWIFPQGVIEWPSFGTPNYIWKKTNPIFLGPKTIIAKDKVDNRYKLGGYVISRYKEGDKNILTNQIAIPGDSIIHSFDNIEYDTYGKYYNDIIKLALEQTDLDTQEKVRIEKDVKSKLEIKTQVEFTFNYGHLKSSVYKKVNNKDSFPNFMKKSFLPYYIYKAEAELDENINKINLSKGAKKGFIWIDPEADYDMKVIRVDPVSTIEYLDPNGEGELKTKINTYIKNKITFTATDKFNISIRKNKEEEIVYEEIDTTFIENWNYENGKIVDNNYEIELWSTKAPNEKIMREVRSKINYNNNAAITGTQSGSQPINIMNNGIFDVDGVKVLLKNNIITRWYIEPKFTMPEFGIDKVINFNIEKYEIEVTEKEIPLYKIKIDSPNNSKIIDPSQITNSKLSRPELYIKDPEFYGHGDEDDIQTLGRLNRYALTDLDTESYYIVEGILKNDNEFDYDEQGNRLNSGKGGKGGWYRLPHALGATSVFIRLIIDIAVKMIPKITKLLKLFNNPFSFISDIMADKLNKNFEFLSDDAIKTFKIANDIKTRTDKIGDLTSINLKKDMIRSDARESSKIILESADGKSDIEQLQARNTSIQIQNDADKKVEELDKISNKKKNLAKKLTDFYSKSILANYVFVDDKSLESIFVLSGGATIPFNIFGADLSFGLASEMNNIPKPPIKLIFPGSVNKFKNIQYLTNSQDKSKKDDKFSKDSEINDIKNIKGQIGKPPFISKQFTSISKENDVVDIQFEDGSIKKISTYNLQSFVFDNSNKYNFIYVTQEINELLIEVDKLILSGTQEDLDKAKEKLELANSKSPSNAYDDKLKEIEKRNLENIRNSQPLLKMILGFVTFPVKVVADIIKWLYDFFISLTNPLKLASKMKEFLSFKWILKFVSPKYILEIFGLKFDATKMGGSDLSKYMSVGCIAKLPTYGKEQLKDLKDQPMRLLSLFKVMGRFINAFIDFIWAIFGIEAIIRPPHMRIVPDNTPYNATGVDIKSLVDGIKPNGKDIDNIINENIINDVDDLDSESGYGFIDNFIYEVKLTDGSIKSFLNREELDKFIQDNKDINFDFTFD